MKTCDSCGTVLQPICYGFYRLYRVSRTVMEAMIPLPLYFSE